MPEEGKTDVKTGQDPSTDPSVKAESLPATDVNTSDPSTEGADKDKKHEDAVPYARFKELGDQATDLKAQLEEKGRELAELTPKEPEIDPFEAITPSKEGQPADTGQLPQNVAELEGKFRDNLYETPMQTLWPFVQEAARQVIAQTKKNESVVRGIPGFKDFEDEYHNVPDDLVTQTQSNPDLIKFLLAKHSKTLKPTISTQTKPSKSPEEKPPEKADQITNMDEYKEKLRKEGESRMIEKIKSGENVMAESASAGQDAGGGGDEPELDESGKLFMAKMGIADTKAVAKRLDSYLKGKAK